MQRPVGGDAQIHYLQSRWQLDEGSWVDDALQAAEPDRPVLLADGRFAESPCVAFRWLKAPGETYGRGPVMKALPDIRTANTVVEMVLKNASIAVTGIWQAEDDGVLNPATVRLVPGTIIPKAPGSAGLTPLAAPGNFDISQLVLNDLRARIRASMLADRLGPPQDAKMTATEVLERGAQTARLLGATYGRSYPGGSTTTHLPTYDTVSRSGNGSSAGLSLTLNMPLFAGFATQNRLRETLALEDKARNDLEAARRSVTQGTRSAFFGVQAGQAQVKALEAAESSSKLALEATQLGYKVGVRVNLDVLNAQTQLFQTQRDLAKARYDVIVGGLKLRQVAGTLAPEDVGNVNALLSN